MALLAPLATLVQRDRMAALVAMEMLAPMEILAPKARAINAHRLERHLDTRF